MGTSSKEFGVRHRECRVRAGLSQPAVAKAVGKHVTTVCAWEKRGRAPGSVETMLELARLYGVRFEWLATGQGNRR